MRLGNIEILRGLAALWVVGVHAEGFIESRGYDLPFGSIFAVGGAGVDLFFVISGFVIALSVLKSKRGVADFVVARLIRIVPAYWAITVLTVSVASVAIALGLRSEAFERLSLEWIGASMFFASQPVFALQPIVYQGWTLEYEMLFYAAVAVSMMVLRNRWYALFGAAIIVVSAIVALDWVTSVALEFVFGVIAAVLFKRMPRFYVAGWLLIFAGLSLVVLIQLVAPGVEREWGFGLPFSFLVLGAATVRQVTSPLALAAGRDSYAVYLVQVLAIPLSGQALLLIGALGAAPVLSFVFMLLVTQISGTLFEVKFDGKLRPWLLTRWERRDGKKHVD